MKPNDYDFAVDENGLTFIYGPMYTSDEYHEEFLKCSRSTDAYVGYVGSDVIRKNPEYAVRIPGSNCWLVLVPHWHKNYIIKREHDETMMIMMDGSGRGMILENGTTTLRLVAVEANIHYDMTPGTRSWKEIYLDNHRDYYNEDDDNFSLNRAVENYDLWTSKEYDTTNTIDQRENLHLELAIAAFKHATNDATRDKALPYLMQRIHDVIIEGLPEWRQIFDDSRKYFASKKRKIEK